MGYRVTVVNPTGFPLSGEPDPEGRVTYRPRIGGRRVAVHVPGEDAQDFRDQHDRLVQARQKRALGLREAAARKPTTTKKKTAKKAAGKKPSKTSANKTTTSKTSAKAAPQVAAGSIEYAIAVKGPKKSWPMVQGTAVGEHFGIHKRDDGHFVLTHRPTGVAVAVAQTKKRLVEIGQTLPGLLGNAADTRQVKTLAVAMRKAPNLARWILAFSSGETTLGYADDHASGNTL